MMPHLSFYQAEAARMEREMIMLLRVRPRTRTIRRRIRRLSQDWTTLLIEAEDAGYTQREVSRHLQRLEQLRRGSRSA